MNTKQALIQAKKRWGKRAAVKHEPGRSKRPHHTGDYVVGAIMGGILFEIKGEGRTWTTALADADMKGAIEKLWLWLLTNDEGYRWMEPGPLATATDRKRAEMVPCESCGKAGLSYYPTHREDGHYRAFAVCGSCGEHQEFKV